MRKVLSTEAKEAILRYKADGLSNGQIAERLNEAGILTPYSKKWKTSNLAFTVQKLSDPSWSPPQNKKVSRPLVVEHVEVKGSEQKQSQLKLLVAYGTAEELAQLARSL